MVTPALSPSLGVGLDTNGPVAPKQNQDSFQSWLDPIGTNAASGSAVDGFVMVELEVRNTSGVEELIALPWRLAATGHLAQQAPIAYPVDEANTMQAEAGVATVAEMLERRSGTPGAATVRMPTAVEGHAAAYAAGPAARSSGPPASNPISDTRALRSYSPAVPASPIAARLMRWFEDQQHHSTVWVRDYRIAEANIDSLVLALRQMTAAEGLELDRVVVNAREVWRAVASTDSETNSCR